MAMDQGSMPVLFDRHNIPRPLLHANTLITVSDETKTGGASVCNRLIPELVAIWVAMTEFCTAINAAAQRGGLKITEETFLHQMGSIVYRLLHLRYAVGTLDEAFRIALLSFSSPIFLHWNRLELPDNRFNDNFRQCLVTLNIDDAVGAREDIIWLLMVAGLSMSHEPENLAWLRPLLRANLISHDISTWGSLKDVLSSYMWVGISYDRVGKELFECAMSQLNDDDEFGPVCV